MAQRVHGRMERFSSPHDQVYVLLAGQSAMTDYQMGKFNFKNAVSSLSTVPDDHSKQPIYQELISHYETCDEAGTLKGLESLSPEARVLHSKQKDIMREWEIDDHLQEVDKWLAKRGTYRQWAQQAWNEEFPGQPMAAKARRPAVGAHPELDISRGPQKGLGSNKFGHSRNSRIQEQPLRSQEDDASQSSREKVSPVMDNAENQVERDDPLHVKEISDQEDADASTQGGDDVHRQRAANTVYKDSETEEKAVSERLQTYEMAKGAKKNGDQCGLQNEKATENDDAAAVHFQKKKRATKMAHMPYISNGKRTRQLEDVDAETARDSGIYEEMATNGNTENEASRLSKGKRVRFASPEVESSSHQALQEAASGTLEGSENDDVNPCSAYQAAMLDRDRARDHAQKAEAAVFGLELEVDRLERVTRISGRKAIDGHPTSYPQLVLI